MVNAGPDSIGTVLDQLVAEVAALATERADQVRQALDDAGHGVGDVLDEAQDLPTATIERIKQLCDPPDWWSLLLVVLLEVSKLDPHLSVGVMRPDGWSRMVTVSYTQDGPDPKKFTVGLAVTDPGLRHGLLLTADAPIELAFGDHLRVEVSARDAARWTWEFGGAVEAPAADAVLDVDLAWKAPVPALAEPAGDVSVGPLHLHATLAKSPAEPVYKLRLGLGVTTDPGLHAQLHVGQALGALGAFLSVADLDERYSPQVELAQGREPLFTLGHSGL